MTTKPRETQIDALLARLDALVLRAFTKHGDDAQLYNGLKELQDELSALLREEAWQPIETAPKDGTFLILATTDKRVGEARWVENAWYWAGNDPTDSYGWPVWEYEAAGWMPLPAAPEGWRGVSPDDPDR